MQSSKSNKTSYRKGQKKKNLQKLLAATGLVLLLILCYLIGSNAEKEPAQIRPEDAPLDTSQLTYLEQTKLDQVDQWKEEAYIDLSTCSQELLITEEGDYHLTGSMDGHILIQAKEENIHLFLDNVNIHSDLGPALYCEEADKLLITLMEGSENFLSDSGRYGEDSDTPACFFSNCDITFNGKGSLTLSAYYQDGIRSKDMVKILSGNYDILCKDTGIRGNDGIALYGGTIAISSEKDGLETTKSGAEGRGSILVKDCDLSIIAGRYGMRSNKGNLYLSDCSFQSRCVVASWKVGGQVQVQEGCVH